MRKLFGIGINTFADPGAALNGCLQDVVTVRKICTDSPLQVDPRDIRLLCDERATRINIFDRLEWCTKGWVNPTPATDKLVIQFSGHGTQVVDRNGDEVGDQQDECLCPYNFPELWDSPKDCSDADACAKYLDGPPGPQICDDDLALFLKKVPEGVYTVLIVDACHSGSVDRDLRQPLFAGPVKTPRFMPAPLDIRSRGMGRSIGRRTFGVRSNAKSAKGPNENVHFIPQRHILLSGCRDNQTSADANINGVAQGAMTWSFNLALEQCGFNRGTQPTWIQVHTIMLDLLKRNGYDQVPQLTGPKEWLEGPVFGI